MFTLTIKTDNAAFEPAWEAEVEHILLRLVNDGKLIGETSGKLRDTNGNTVGKWLYEND